MPHFRCHQDRPHVLVSRCSRRTLGHLPHLRQFTDVYQPSVCFRRRLPGNTEIGCPDRHLLRKSRNLFVCWKQTVRQCGLRRALLRIRSDMDGALRGVCPGEPWRNTLYVLGDVAVVCLCAPAPAPALNVVAPHLVAGTFYETFLEAGDHLICCTEGWATGIFVTTPEVVCT